MHYLEITHHPYGGGKFRVSKRCDWVSSNLELGSFQEHENAEVFANQMAIVMGVEVHDRREEENK